MVLANLFELETQTLEGALVLARETGLDGLPAGAYVLLPAHYALLKGAWLVMLAMLLSLFTNLMAISLVKPVTTTRAAGSAASNSATNPATASACRTRRALEFSRGGWRRPKSGSTPS